MDLENKQLPDSKNKSLLENKKTEESDQICETENTSLNDPMNWSIKKKTVHRSILIALTIYVVASTVCAISNNIWQLLVAYVSVSAVQSIGAGTISDIFIPTGAILVLIYFALFRNFSSPQLSLVTTPLPKKRFNPFLPFDLLRYPNLSLSILYISNLFSDICPKYLCSNNFFNKVFNLSPSNIGLVFLSPGVE
ncbi:30100_t:CDS:2 [Gigaspora margarita]|uniref:30100_t:CDS:1 n=1 Tax=Gigaspora margarita TaxID=4874 RepID=A0ABN7UYX9_GIGMA|nr:30100_t:CDS:2 [Gigaspora margarita]